MTQILILLLIGAIWLVIVIIGGIVNWFEEMGKEAEKRSKLAKAKQQFLDEIRKELNSQASEILPNPLAEAQSEPSGKGPSSMPVEIQEQSVSSTEDIRSVAGSLARDLEHLSFYMKKDLQAALKDADENSISKFRNIWIHFFITNEFIKRRCDTEDYIQNAFGMIKPEISAKDLLRRFDKFSFPETQPTSKSDEPYVDITDPPTLETLKQSYVSWSKPFSICCKDRFVLSEKELNLVFQWELLKWEKNKKALIEKNKIIESKNKNTQYEFQVKVQQWENRKLKFETLRNALRVDIEKELSLVTGGNSQAIAEFVRLILRSLSYPNAFPFECEVMHTRENKSLMIEFRLPAPDDMPTIKETRYLKTKGTYKEIPYKESERNTMYDDALYKITLNCIRIVFQVIDKDWLEMVTFNGWVRYIDRSTGNHTTSCILSIQANRRSIMEINFDHVDAKACFRQLKGISASKLFNLAAIRPILEINKADKRFVESLEIGATLTNVTNVASMPWEDFEHLIRGLFEKYFQRDGVEVKVTRASRDGGVDAVFFDNDPIKGGKIVIQAKRYINTVGVEAVRDLFGTVHSEGAMKGILVTTAEYSPEAYEFAKGKPLTLLSGNNLLHMLHECGYEARIDLNEARKVFNAERTDKNKETA